MEEKEKVIALELFAVTNSQNRRSDGRAVAPYQQGNTHFSMERGMRTTNWV
jgi:hypothetical protein